MIRLWSLSFVFIAATAQAPATTQTPASQNPQTPQTLQMPQTPMPTSAGQATSRTPAPPVQISDDDRTLMLTLLERVEKLSTEFKNDSKSGQLMVERSTMDEISADVQQVRAILKR